MKKDIHYIVVAARFYADGKTHESNGKKKVLVNEDCFELDRAFEFAKTYLKKRQWNIIDSIWLIDDIDELTKEQLLAVGKVYSQMSYESSSDEYWEEYISIVPKEYTFKTWLKQAFEWFLVFLLGPILIVKNFIRGIRIVRKYPVDVIARFRDEWNNTEWKDRGKLVDKYFNEEEP